MGSHVQLEPGTSGFLVFVTLALLGASISSWSTKPEEQMDGHKGEVKQPAPLQEAADPPTDLPVPRTAPVIFTKDLFAQVSRGLAHRVNAFPFFQLTSVKAELSTSTMLLGNPLKLQSKPQVSEHSHTGFSRTSDQRFALGMSGFAEDKWYSTSFLCGTRNQSASFRREV
ncbi:hypothetical protein Anapl_03832 [Anas platyrhynchos]|uniref:Uncharacterized protein n=1 Tax=Anas platyrhynchos TaxID=8839 RepID=R0LAM7_ANAPL|nr:hypothetical protein Anapl_03832 [Anas platyrhynchos]